MSLDSALGLRFLYGFWQRALHIARSGGEPGCIHLHPGLPQEVGEIGWPLCRKTPILGRRYFTLAALSQ
jgi:hypothetical protein